eukprot:GEMP01000211.1.p1 GENE.GEMP01000211.1~~GEMP01000211.1.p1  ORF type:complete len:2350 (+),score=577.42 GEMP01000211.1:933-7052(+)
MDVWIPADVARTLPADHRELKTEYSMLLREKLLAEGGVSADPVSDATLNRLAVIEDAVDNFLLSRWQATEINHVMARVEKMKMKKEEELKRLEEEERKNSSWKNWFLGRVPKKEETPEHSIALTEEEEQTLFEELNDESKVEAVIVPSTAQFSFAAPAFEMKLLSGPDTPLFVAVGQTNMTIAAEEKVDYKGVRSAEWTIGMRLRQLNVQTLNDNPVLMFNGNEETGFSMSVANKLEQHRNVMCVRLEAGNTQSYLKPHVFVPTMSFFDVSSLGLGTSEKHNNLYIQEKLKSALEDNENKLAQMKKSLGERTPEFLELYVDVAAPEFYITAADQASAQLGLGRLTLMTPKACSLDELHLKFQFTDTSLQIVTSTNERFSVLRPVPIEVELEIINQPNALNIGIVVKIEAITLNLAPQAALVVLALPSALSGIAATRKSVPRRQVTGLDPNSFDTFASIDGILEPLGSIASEGTRACSKFGAGLEDVYPNGAPLPDDTKQQTDDTKPRKEWGTAARVALQNALQRGRQLQESKQEQTIQCDVQFPAMDVTLSNSVVPVLRVQMAMPDLHVERRVKGDDINLDLSLEKNFAVGVDFFNPRVGIWEPLLEYWELSLVITQTLRTMDISCRAAAPLLLNLTPTAINTVSWYVPHFMRALSSTPAARISVCDKTSSTGSGDGKEAKWRALNLTQQRLNLRFTAGGVEVGIMTLEPGGSAWVSMDHSVLPTLADQVTITAKDSTHGSEVVSDPLALHQQGTTVVGNMHCQMVSPHPSHKLLLCTFVYTLHNTLDTALEVSFDGQAVTDLSRLTAPLALLGDPDLHQSAWTPDRESTAITDRGISPALTLKPNEFVSITRSTIFIRPVNTLSWCEQIAKHVGTRLITIPATSRSPQFCVRAEWQDIPSGPPYNNKRQRLVLRPALYVVNALPMPMVLTVNQEGHDIQVPLQALTCKQLHDFDPTQEVKMSMCLGDGVMNQKLACSIDAFVPEKAGEADTVKQVKLGCAENEGLASVHVSLGHTIRISAAWLINRSQMAISFHDMKGFALPKTKTGIVLLSEREFKVTTHEGTQAVEIPTDFGCIQWDKNAVCMQMRTFGSIGGDGRALYILPAVVFTNTSAVALRIRTAEGERMLPPMESSIYNGRSKTCEFKVGALNWSKPIRLEAEVAGSWSYLVAANTVWTVEVCPGRGLMAVNFSITPAFVFCHKGPDVEVTVNSSIIALPNTTVGIGWQDPMGTDKYAQTQQLGVVELTVDGKSYSVCVHKTGDVDAMPGYKFKSRRQRNVTSITLEGRKLLDQATSMNIQVNAALSRVGISLVSEARMEELLYIQCDIFRGCFLIDKENDVQKLDIVLADCQVDCQLYKRFAMEPGDDPKKKNTLFQQKLAGNRAVIFGNAGESEFMVLSLVRVATASRDLVLNKLELRCSPIETNLDDEVITSVQQFVRAAFLSNTNKVCDNVVLHDAQTTFLSDFTNPDVPTVLQMDELKLGGLDISPWLSLSLKNMAFLPEVVKVILRTLTLSGNLTVEGGSLYLDEKKVAFRGPAATLATALMSEYRNSILKSLASLLGCSSLLNVPRVPIQLGQNVGSYSVGTLGTIVGEASSLLDHLTFDSEYIAEQKRLRKQKKIDGIGAGLSEGLKSIGEAGTAVFSVFTEPVKAARKGGIGGFFSGLAKGAVSTVVKPITKLGQAAEDLTAGIASEIGTGGKVLGVKQSILLYRKRQPRLLFGELGAVRKWSVFEARVWMSLFSMCRGVHVVIPLGKTEEDNGETFACLLLFSSCMRLAKVPIPTVDEDEEDDTNFFDAIGGATGKIAANLMVPLRTVAHGGAAVLNPVISLFEEENVLPQEIVDRILWGLDFRNVKHGSVQDGSIVFVDHNNHKYSIPSQSITPVVRKSLVEMVLQHNMVWDDLKKHLLTGHSQVFGDERNSAREAQTVCVYQVQRSNLVNWVPPFLPAETDKQKMWMDMQLDPHPKLNQKLSLEQLVNEPEPPIDMGALWKPVGNWEIVRENADADGWAYAVNWGATVWTKENGWFDVVRRRLWKRTYQ